MLRLNNVSTRWRRFYHKLAGGQPSRWDRVELGLRTARQDPSGQALTYRLWQKISGLPWYAWAINRGFRVNEPQGNSGSDEGGRFFLGRKRLRGKILRLANRSPLPLGKVRVRACVSFLCPHPRPLSQRERGVFFALSQRERGVFFAISQRERGVFFALSLWERGD